MSPFRIIILSLLSLALILLLYIVAYVIPERSAQYTHYQSSERASNIINRHNTHAARMDAISPVTEGSPLNTALRNAEQMRKKNDQALIEAEEQSIIAEGIRQEKLARLATEAEATKAAEVEKKEQNIIGNVNSYDPDWAVLYIRPRDGSVIDKGTRIAVQRNEGIVAEAIIEEFDQGTGLWSASVQPNTISASSAKIIPEVGDIVIIFAIECIRQNGLNLIPSDRQDGSPASAYSQPRQSSDLDSLPEIDIPFNPTR